MKKYIGIYILMLLITNQTIDSLIIINFKTISTNFMNKIRRRIFIY